jgi:hypothetical protein
MTNNSYKLLPSSIESILYQTAPTWHNVTEDTSELSEELIKFLEGFDGEERYWFNKNNKDFHAIKLAIWILDKLLPEDESEIFYSLHQRFKSNDFQWLIFAWARRLDLSKEKLMFDERWFKKERIGRSFRGAIYGWLELAKKRNPDHLLQWWQLCKDNNLNVEDDWYSSSNIIDDYALLKEDKQDAINNLLEVARQKKGEKSYNTPITSRCLRVIINLIAETVELSPQEKPESNEELFDFLVNCLNKYGFPNVADFCKEACIPNKGYGLIKGIAKRLWVRSLYNIPWDELKEKIYEIEDQMPYEGLRLLEKVVPHEALEIWHIFFMFHERGLFPIGAFCRWLPNDFRDVLIPFFTYHDLEVAACAYQSYLYKTPKTVLDYNWNYDLERKRTPFWQLQILDRYLFAPDAIKPPCVVHDVQEVEYDMRLHDPLNIRCF